MPSSGAGGPCCHCGRTNSCCWRRGPANKPILCNACGSRYLVKRNLDNYVPLATRQDRAAAAKEGVAQQTAQRRAGGPAAGRVTKQKRAMQKRMAAEALSDDPEQSDVSSAAVFTADQCAAAQASTGTCTAALVANLSYITSQAQLKGLGGTDLSALAGTLFAGSTLRHKPRKPLVVTVSAVW